MADQNQAKNMNKQSLVDKIDQENRQLAEIEKVARYDGKGMFWQWVNVGKWFLGGMLTAVILNIILGQFVFNLSKTLEDKEIQTQVFDCLNVRKNTTNLELFDQELKTKTEEICQAEVFDKLKIGEPLKWFNYPLNSDVQGFLNRYIFITPSLIILSVVFGVLFLIWLKYYWNRISANFLEINFTEKLIFAIFGFWVALEMLGFKVDFKDFAHQIWAGNSAWKLLLWNIPIWDFGNPINFYWFRDFDSLGLSTSVLFFYYFSFTVVFIRLILALWDFWKGVKLVYDESKYELVETHERFILSRIYYTACLVLTFLFVFLFLPQVQFDYFFIFYFISFLIAHRIVAANIIMYALDFNKKLKVLEFKLPKEKAIYKKIRIISSFASFAGLLGLMLLVISATNYSFLIAISTILSLLSFFSLLTRNLVNYIVTIGLFFFIVFVFLLYSNLLINFLLIIYLGIMVEFYFIFAQIIISNLISKLLITAKQNSIIKAEEPLDDFEHVKEILGNESKFLESVEQFSEKKILKYPHQNLQNRSQVYAIDARWGHGKSTFIKLVQSLVCKQEEFGWKVKISNLPFSQKLEFVYKKFEDQKNQGNINLNIFNPKSFLQWSGLGFRQGQNDVVWIDFNPWNYLSGEKMVVDFFDTIDNRLGKIYGFGLGKKLNKYVNLLTSTVSPTFLGLAEKFGGWEFGLNPLSSSSDLGSLKSDIETKLRSIKEKIVIVIDDIDRLPPEMVLIVLRLVGITANFPNIFFVLAMDYDKIESLVQRKLGTEYQNYLQKIVNERIKVPAWSYEDLQKMFEKYTENAIKQFKKLEGLEGFEKWLEFEYKKMWISIL